MLRIEVFSGPHCPYCERAKALLKKKKVTFEEFDVKSDSAKFAEMFERSKGRKTIPQIFINGEHIGGCDDLYALDGQGRLDALLVDPT
ncbi:MAG: glutaredoxin 3 [Candidatus Obscuribacterales bacterium]|nr:glutaredoxin 3 [Candidatus Obscuribacterales bacterium]